MKQSVAGNRKQQRLADLHRAVSGAIQNLHQHQLVLVTALRGDDAAIQQSMLEEHRARVAAATQALAALDTFIDRCRMPTASNAAEDATTPVILRAS
jgi:hypothetical protein